MRVILILLVVLLSNKVSAQQEYWFNNEREDMLIQFNQTLSDSIIKVSKKASKDARKALSGWVRDDFKEVVYFYLKGEYKAFFYILYDEENKQPLGEALIEANGFYSNYEDITIYKTVTTSSIVGVSYIEYYNPEEKLTVGALLMIYK